MFVFVLLIGAAFFAYYFTNGEILKTLNAEGLKKLMAFKISRQLTFESNPKGAEVWIDGKPWGTTPLTLNMTGEEGERHQLELKKDGYETLSDVFYLTKETALKPYSLKSTEIEMNVVSEPAEIRVRIDDGPEQPVQNGQIRLDAGKPHTLEFSADGYRSRKIQLAANEILAEKIVLDPVPKPGLVKIDSEYPVTVTVYQGKRLILKRTVQPGGRLKLDPAMYTIHLAAPTVFYSASYPIEVVPGRQSKLVTRPLGLVRKVVISNGWAYVSIDGRDMGETPLNNVKIATGMHKFRLWRSNGKSKEIERAVTVERPLVIEERL